MGYTHYWENPEGFTSEQWKGIIEDVEKLLNNLPEHSTSSRNPGKSPLAVDDQEGGPPIVTREKIFFNGSGGEVLDHETFQLTPYGTEFEFCKTARKPYDIAVQGVLLIAKHWYPEFQVRSDGNKEDWEPARELVEEVLGYKVPIYSL